LQGLLTTEDGKEALKLVEDLFSDDLTEEAAARVYQLVADGLVPTEPAAPDVPSTNMWATIGDCDLDDDETVKTLVEYSINGVDCVINVEELKDFEYARPYPAVLIPENCSPSAFHVMLWQASLGDRIAVHHGQFDEVFPWYALSVTPRKQLEERGTRSDGFTWYERMLAQVEFIGPVFHARDDKDEAAKRWASIFNTTWLEEVLSGKETCAYPQVVLAPATLLETHPPDVPNHARGVGIVDGRLVLSSLCEARDSWSLDCRQDSRLHFPMDVLKILLQYPEVYHVKDVDDYLNARVPLVIVATINDTVHESFFYPGMTFKPDANTALAAFVVPNAFSETESSAGGVKLPPSAPVVPPRLKKVAETQDSEWGIPTDASAPGWQLKSVGVKKPHSEVPAYSDKVSVTKIGNWDAIDSQLQAAGLTPDLVKQFYSVHWQAANSDRQHPVVKYHHPAWTDSLKGKSINRRKWYWPTGALAPSPWLSTNDAGQMPLFGSEAQTAIKKRQQKMNNVQFFTQNPTRRGGRGGSNNLPGRHVPPANRRGGGPAPRGRGQNLSAREEVAALPDETDVDQLAHW
jgi:hypothetical protein